MLAHRMTRYPSLEKLHSSVKKANAGFKVRTHQAGFLCRFFLPYFRKVFCALLHTSKKNVQNIKWINLTHQKTLSYFFNSWQKTGRYVPPPPFHSIGLIKKRWRNNKGTENRLGVFWALGGHHCKNSCEKWSFNKKVPGFLDLQMEKETRTHGNGSAGSFTRTRTQECAGNMQVRLDLSALYLQARGHPISCRVSGSRNNETSARHGEM